MGCLFLGCVSEKENDAMALANEKERQLSARLDKMDKKLPRLAGREAPNLEDGNKTIHHSLGGEPRRKAP